MRDIFLVLSLQRRFHKCEYDQSVSYGFLDSCFRRNDDLSVRENDDLSVRENDDLSVRGNDERLAPHTYIRMHYPSGIFQRTRAC